MSLVHNFSLTQRSFMYRHTAHRILSLPNSITQLDIVLFDLLVSLGDSAALPSWHWFCSKEDYIPMHQLVNLLSCLWFSASADLERCIARYKVTLIVHSAPRLPFSLSISPLSLPPPLVCEMPWFPSGQTHKEDCRGHLVCLLLFPLSLLLGCGCV